MALQDDDQMEDQTAFLAEDDEEDDGELPDQVVEAMINAGNDLQDRETWATSTPTMAMISLSRLIAAILATTEMVTDRTQRKVEARRICLRVLAYMPANLRIAAIMRIARTNPRAIDDLMLGRIPESDQIFRYNVIRSIGIFARHSLIAEVMTIERMERVSMTIASIRADRKGIPVDVMREDDNQDEDAKS